MWGVCMKPIKPYEERLDKWKCWDRDRIMWTVFLVDALMQHTAWKADDAKYKKHQIDRIMANARRDMQHKGTDAELINIIAKDEIKALFDEETSSSSDVQKKSKEQFDGENKW